MEDFSDGSLQDRVVEFAKKNWIVLALFSAGLILLSIGLMQMLGNQNSQANSDFKPAAEVAGAATSSGSFAKIKVDVEGEVLHPGVYDLDLNSRVQDALIAAGGLSSTADRNYVNRTINLAQKIADGAKIYIPKIGEAAVSNSAAGSAVTTSVSNTSGPISINSATAQELDSLPSIGPVTAQKIIDNRPYNTIDDLVAKKAVGKATFEKIKDLISL